MKILTLNMQCNPWRIWSRTKKIGDFIRENEIDITLLQEVPSGICGDMSGRISYYANQDFSSVQVHNIVGKFWQVRQTILWNIGIPIRQTMSYFIDVGNGWNRKVQIVTFPAVTVINVHVGYEGDVVAQWNRLGNLIKREIMANSNKIILAGDFNTESDELFNQFRNIGLINIPSSPTYNDKRLDQIWLGRFSNTRIRSETCLEGVSDHLGLLVELEE